MAPIPRILTNPLSIITGALFGAISGPDSTFPSNGTNATIWGSDYKGSASFQNLTLIASTAPSNASTPIPSSSSLVYFTNQPDTYLGCDNKTFTSWDNIVLMNPLQFGDVFSSNTTCGDLDDLAPSLPFFGMTFDPTSSLTVSNLTDPISPLSVETPISPYDLVHIVWSLSDPPNKPEPTKPTPTLTTSTTLNLTTTTTKTTKSPSPKPTKTSRPAPPPSPKPTKPAGKKFSGRGTWYSDTTGQCEHRYSQSDMIVAVNEAQMGNGKNLCGRKLLVTAKGSSASVVVTVVDMCPSKYCNFGDLDLSQGAFKKFAGLGKGVLELSWTFTLAAVAESAQYLLDLVQHGQRVRKQYIVAVEDNLRKAWAWSPTARQGLVKYLRSRHWHVIECPTEAVVEIGRVCRPNDSVVSGDSDLLMYEEANEHWRPWLQGRFLQYLIDDMLDVLDFCQAQLTTHGIVLVNDYNMNIYGLGIASNLGIAKSLQESHVHSLIQEYLRSDGVIIKNADPTMFDAPINVFAKCQLILALKDNVPEDNVLEEDLPKESLPKRDLSKEGFPKEDAPS
ncbi:hypothetical protein CPB97_008693 [Podila verticillata]|nr:hypothetical protein CPB97_008693 [Podila verticillata]